MRVEPVRWHDGVLTIIDQTRLPGECRHETLASLDDVWRAIKRLEVRGAPAIGVCAAFGLLVALRERRPQTLRAARHALALSADHLATSRPTAVNLFWALDRMRAVTGGGDEDGDPQPYLDALEREAVAIFEEDLDLCRRIGEHGARSSGKARGY